MQLHAIRMAVLHERDGAEGPRHEAEQLGCAHYATDGATAHGRFDSVATPANRTYVEPEPRVQCGRLSPSSAIPSRRAYRAACVRFASCSLDSNAAYVVANGSLAYSERSCDLGVR